MFLIVLFVVVVVSGIFLIKYESTHIGFYFCGMLLTAVAFVGCVLSPLTYISNKIKSNNDQLSYSTFAQTYKLTCSNYNITGEERIDVLTRCEEWNIKIQDHRLNVSNFLVGVYYSKKIANMELFDIQKIPTVQAKSVK